MQVVFLCLDKVVFNEKYSKMVAAKLFFQLVWGRATMHALLPHVVTLWLMVELLNMHGVRLELEAHSNTG